MAKSAKAKRQKGFDPARLIVPIILVAVLAGGVLALVYDRGQRSKADTVFAALSAKIDEEDKSVDGTKRAGARTGPAEVAQIVGQPAASSLRVGGGLRETYRFGLMGRYILYVVYSPGDKSFLDNVSLNTKPPGFD